MSSDTRWNFIFRPSKVIEVDPKVLTGSEEMLCKMILSFSLISIVGLIHSFFSKEPESFRVGTRIYL